MSTRGWKHHSTLLLLAENLMLKVVLQNLARFNKSVEAVEEIVETAKKCGPSKTSQAELLSQAKDALRIDSRLERELRAVKRAM